MVPSKGKPLKEKSDLFQSFYRAHVVVSWAWLHRYGLFTYVGRLGAGSRD